MAYKNTSKPTGSLFIEITGPMGSGKSFLQKKILGIVQDHYKIYHVGEGVQDPSHKIPNIVTDINLHGIKTDLYLFIWSGLAIVKWNRFFFFALYLIFKSDENPTTKIALFRSLWRKIGLIQYFRQRKFRNSIVLIDESIFHFSHNVLMSKSFHANQKTVSKFVNFVPKADALFCLSADFETLKSRVLKRGEITNRVNTENELESFLLNAISLYRKIELALCNNKKAIIVTHDSSYSTNCLLADLKKLKVID